MSNTITVTITGERLAAMYDNDQSLWITPGSDRPYWGAFNSFAEDVCIGDASTVLDAWNDQQGDVLDIDDIRSEESELEVELNIDASEED